jgi:hypothetical protein
LLCWVGVHCGIYKGSCNVSNWSYLNSFPLLRSFILPLPIPGIVLIGIIFTLIYMCTQCLHHIHPLPPYSTTSQPHHWYQFPPHPGKNLFSDFVEEKSRKKKIFKWRFCLFEIKIVNLHREFPCDIFMYIRIITLVGLSPLFFFILP